MYIMTIRAFPRFFHTKKASRFCFTLKQNYQNIKWRIGFITFKCLYLTKRRFINMMRISLFLMCICFSIKYLDGNNCDDNPQQTASESAPTLREYKNFTEFLENCLDKKVVQYTVKPLTIPGDNYNSMLQAIEVKSILSNDSHELETMQFVAKTTLAGVISPTQSKQFWNEVHFYSDIIPAIEKFERSSNIPEADRIDAFVRYFGSRLSLDNGDVNADEDGVILFENLKSSGFISSNRWERFDRDEVLAILKRLAKLHALFIGIRRLQPNLYYSKIDPFMHTLFNDSHVETIIGITKTFVENISDNFSNVPEHLKIAIENALNHSKDYLRKPDTLPESPYTTIFHRDIWSKNIMIRRGQNSEDSIQVKLLDFQAYYSGTFAFDLIFFLLFNGRIDDLRADFKSFIDYYHVEFVNVLRLINCPLEDYTNEKMWHEIVDKAKLHLLKIYLYLSTDKVVLLRSQSISTPVDPNEFYLNQPTPKSIVDRWNCINDLYLENGFF